MKYVIATRSELKGQVKGALAKAKYIEFDVRTQTNPDRVVIESAMPIETIKMLFGSDYIVELEQSSKTLP